MSVVWCAGMYASGSTWTYNVMRALAAADSARTVHSLFGNTVADLAGIADRSALHVIKTHDLPEDAATLLLSEQPRVVVTIRDPRDAVASLMTYQRYPFAMALNTVDRSARFVTAVAARTGALLLRYETGFTGDAATVAAIAAAIGLRADEAACAAIFAATRREAVEAFIGGLDNLPQAHRDARSGDVFDPQSQWHKHHAGRTGEVGRWKRTLQPAQTEVVEQTLADWMAANGYAKSSPAERGPVFPTGYTLSRGGPFG
jgi:hypothetical protein